MEYAEPHLLKAVDNTNCYCIGLFSKASLEQNLAGRLSALLEIPVERSSAADDVHSEVDLPTHVCRGCKNTAGAGEEIRGFSHHG